jgi:hypothetical protein
MLALALYLVAIAAATGVLALATLGRLHAGGLRAPVLRLVGLAAAVLFAGYPLVMWLTHSWTVGTLFPILAVLRGTTVLVLALGVASSRRPSRLHLAAQIAYAVLIVQAMLPSFTLLPLLPLLPIAGLALVDSRDAPREVATRIT